MKTVHHRKCPKCKTSLRGDPIPKKDQKVFGGHKFFGREIALYDRDLDMTTHYRCPDCGFTWKRWEK
jgi:hypothetical protein